MNHSAAKQSAPPRDDSRVNLLDLDRDAMVAWLLEMGQKPYRAQQLLQWIHRHGERDFGQMSNLARSFRESLAQTAVVRLPQVVMDRTASDGTRKWVLELVDGNRVETIYIPEQSRGTLCISSQVGCQLNCSFCSTAQQGFNRNLTAGEIIAQLWLATRLIGDRPPRQQRITNVVMMGMGEPLLNFEPVVTAMRLMMDDLSYGLARKRVTLSTAGVVPGIDRLRDAAPVSLAVSLHAADDALRDQLVPLNRRYPIAELLAACRRYIAPETNRKITFEYAMLAGVNDSPAQAKALVRLLSTLPSKVNLIPWNPFPGAPYRCSSPAAIDRFRRVLADHGMVATVRKTRGDDIDAACGQLVGQVLPRQRRRLHPDPLAAEATT